MKWVIVARSPGLFDVSFPAGEDAQKGEGYGGMDTVPVAKRMYSG
jgi:hypothetical protein